MSGMPMPASARAWMGDVTPSTELGRESLSPSEPSTDARWRWRNVIDVGVQPRAVVGRIPSAENDATASVTGAHEHDVTRHEGHGLGVKSFFELLGLDCGAGLQPLDVTQARQVDEDSATDDAGRHLLDGTDRAAGAAHLAVGLDVVVEPPAEVAVAQGVDVRHRLPVEVRAHEVGVDAGLRSADIAELRHVVQRRPAVVRTGDGVEVVREAHCSAVADERRRCHQRGRRQVVQRAPLVFGTPAQPVADAVEQLAEGAGVHGLRVPFHIEHDQLGLALDDDLVAVSVDSSGDEDASALFVLVGHDCLDGDAVTDVHRPLEAHGL